MIPVMGVVLAGHSKDYAIPKFLEMAEKYVDCRIVFVVDDYRSEIPYRQIKVSKMQGCFWATEIVYHGKEALKEFVINSRYTHLIWQGIDCYYHSKDDFQKLIRCAGTWDITGALVAGRNKPSYPVCREYIRTVEGKITTKQRELKGWELDISTPIVVSGYIGSDATSISKVALANVDVSGYEHWHERPNKDTPLGELGPEEWFMYRAIKQGYVPVVDPGNRPYHAHEDGTVVRYKGLTYRLEDLEFPNDDG